MALRDYMRILLRRGWIIVLLAVVAALSAFVFSRYLVKPEYRSEVLLSVLPTRPADWGSGQGAKGMLNNFAEQIRQNDDIAARVADVLKLDLPADDLKGRIQVDPDELNLTLRIRATDADPIIAKRIAQAFAQTFVEFRDSENQKVDQRDRILASITRNARDGDRFKPQTRVNLLAGAVLGALLGLIIVFGLEYAAAGTVRGAEDVEKYLGTNVLGMIPAGANDPSHRPAPTTRAEAERRASPAK